MWEVSFTQSYFDVSGEYAGSDSHWVLESKFGDTQTLLKELQSLENCPELEVTPDDIDSMWKECRQNPLQPVSITIARGEYLQTAQYDDFEGTTEAEVNCQYVSDKKKPKPVEDNSEQLELFSVDLP